MNSVVQTFWELIGTDSNGQSAIFDGASPFTSVGATGTFITFEHLQETDVLGWIQDHVYSLDYYQDHIYNEIYKKIDEKINATVDIKLPWKTE